jgi:hypothetical protein
VVGFAVVLLKAPKFAGETMLQVTAVLLVFTTVAVIVDDWPGFRVLGLAVTDSVMGTPDGVPLLLHAAKKIKLPTIKNIEKLRTAASSDNSSVSE